jgi:hypothetical protein
MKKIFFALCITSSVCLANPQPPSGTFDSGELSELQSHSVLLVQQARRESQLSGSTEQMIQKFYQKSQTFVNHCLPQATAPSPICFTLLNDTWNAFYPINPVTGRLRGHRGEFPLIFVELDAILHLLNEISY